MPGEISTGIDNKINSASAITSSAAGWADRVVNVMEALRSAENRFGDAAFKDTGTSSGDVPECDSSGHIPTSVIDTATAGGSSSSGKVPLLNSLGQLASSMISGSTGGGGPGLKHIWVYTNVAPDGSSSSPINGQYPYTWRPRDGNGTYTDTTRLLVFCTGGGGAGSFGPYTLQNNSGDRDGSGNWLRGAFSRKGGGGGAGATCIVYLPNINGAAITNDTTVAVRVGQGGGDRTHGSNSSVWNGKSSTFGTNITARGGEAGRSSGQGGKSLGGAIGNLLLGTVIPGGDGHDGSFDRLGGGSGGSSLYGGGYSGGGGRPLNSPATSAPGAGGGAANGSSGVSPYNWNGQVNGPQGNHGLVMIWGF